MKKNLWLFLGIIVLLIVTVGAYFWATAIMDSLFAFRSPFADDPPMSNPLLDEPLTGRLVMIVVDALREDTAMDQETMPFLAELRQNGAWATMHSIPPSYSAPSWTTILTGAQPDINDGQAANPPDNDNVRSFTQDDIFAAADRAGLKTAVSGFAWFDGMLSNSGVDSSFYTIGEDNAADIDVVNAALPWLQNNDHQLILIHLDQVDYAGHYEGGPQGENWNAAASRVDAMIEEITSYLDLEKDTILVMADHGHIDRGGHGGQDPIVLIQPLIMAGKSIIPGNYPDIQQVDIAPTVSALLGIDLPGTNQGLVLTEMLSLSSGQETIIIETLLTQRSDLLQSYQIAIDIDPSEETLSTIDEIDTAMEDSKIQRLNQERIPRAIIALIIAIFPAYLLFKMWGKATAWLLGGAVLYTIIFNLIYAVIIGKTYSLSSVYSADDLIFSTAIYAAISLLVTWIVIMLSLRAFSIPPSSAAKLTLGLTNITLYLLLLPILWMYFKNGIIVTWTLPEFSSMFLGFLSTVQSLIVSVLGILLIGISALIAKLIPNK